MTTTRDLPFNAQAALNWFNTSGVIEIHKKEGNSKAIPVIYEGKVYDANPDYDVKISPAELNTNGLAKGRILTALFQPSYERINTNMQVKNDAVQKSYLFLDVKAGSAQDIADALKQAVDFYAKKFDKQGMHLKAKELRDLQIKAMSKLYSYEAITVDGEVGALHFLVEHMQNRYFGAPINTGTPACASFNHVGPV